MGKVDEARAPRQGKAKQAGGKRPQKSGQANEPAPVCASVMATCHCHSVTPSRPLLPTHLVPLLRLSLFISGPSLCLCLSPVPWENHIGPVQKAKTPNQADAGVADTQMHQTHAARTHARTYAAQARQSKADKARTHPSSWMLPSKSHSHWLTACPASLPNPDSPSCSTLTLSSSHPRLTACFLACFLA